MRRIYVPEPVSGGILLSYKCTSECKHCMYACSPRWKGDWISEGDAEKILNWLAGKIQESPLGKDRVGINYGLHFTGGEPFLNFSLLLRVTRIANELEIPSTFVETNCFWCVDEGTTREKLWRLREAGLQGILISVNPFTLEHVPGERIERAVRVSREIFGRNTMIYQQPVYSQLKRLGIIGTLTLKDYLRRVGIQSLSYIELLPMGRAVYKLGYLYKRYPAGRFFSQSCREELTRNWHIHIDNYRNYMAGYCGGISMGDAGDLDSFSKGIDLNERPVLVALMRSIRRLYELGRKFGYREDSDGYISKCHLCLDIRRHIIEQTDQFRELAPREFYRNLQ